MKHPYKFEQSFDSTGSASLQTIFSTFSGILFVLVFYNLVSYVGATGAIKEAARKTARCLTPTDPNCVQSLGTDSSIDRDWYGRVPPDPVIDLSIRTFKYEASLPGALWGATYNSFRTLTAEQPYNLVSQKIPRKVFRAIQPLEVPVGNNSGTFSVPAVPLYTPASNPNFPDFQMDRSDVVNAEIQRIVRNQNRDEWAVWLEKQPVKFNTPVQSNLVVIQPGEIKEITTKFIPVEALDFNPEAKVNCTDELCSSNAYAGDTKLGAFDKKAWRNLAYVAAKVFATVRSATPGRTGEAQWGLSANEPGLEIEIRSKDDEPLSFDPYLDNTFRVVDDEAAEAARCLGSAGTKKDVGSSWAPYNMWLRGPAGANGGQKKNAVCRGGNVKHDAIRVPRGGSYKVTARLYNKGSVPIEAHMTLLTYHDKFNKVEQDPKPLKCLPTPFEGADQMEVCDISSCTPDCSDPNNYCPPAGETLEESLSYREPISKTSCEAEITSNIYTCEESERTLSKSDRRRLLPASSNLTIKAAVCSEDWQLDYTAPTGERRNGNFACGYRETDTEEIIVGSAPEGCSLAEPVPEEGSCGGTLLTTERPNEENCPEAFARRESIRRETFKVNDLQPSGAPKFASRPKLEFGDKINPRKEFAWMPVGENDSVEHVLSKEAGIEKPKPSSGAAYKPEPEEFINAILAESGGSESDRGWEQFKASLSSRLRITKIEDRKIDIDQVYPFNQSEVEEIYYGQKDGSARWDFDTDCNTDNECDCIANDSCSEDFLQFESAEKMLRHYASKQVPEAADEDFAFDFIKPVHIGYKNIGQSLAGSNDLPTCFPVQGVCNQNGLQAAELTFIKTSNEEPTECKDGTYASCISKITPGTDFDEVEIKEAVDLELAKQIGLNELQEIFPFATLEESCGDTPGCAEISIDMSSETNAEVSINYQMPISFPLTSILDQDSITLSYTKSEVIERKIAGTSASYRNSD